MISTENAHLPSSVGLSRHGGKRVRSDPEAIPELKVSASHSEADVQHRDELREASSIEEQILVVRKFFQSHPAESISSGGWARLDPYVDLFFLLPSNSSLKNVISSCFNKLPPSVAESLVPIFETRLANSEPPLCTAVLRCFENCWIAKKAALNIGADISRRLMTHLELYCSEKEEDPRGQESVDTVGFILRALLSLSSSQNCTDFSASEPMLQCLMSESKWPVDVQVNAALCIIGDEMSKDLHFIEKVDAILNGGDGAAFGSGHWTRRIQGDWSAKLSCCHALLVSVTEERLGSGKEGISAHKVMNAILDTVMQISKEVHEAKAVLQHSRVVLQWIQRFDSLLRKGVFQTGPEDDSSFSCLSTLEDYVWSFIGSTQDAVRHNVRNVFAKMIAMLKESSSGEYHRVVRRTVGLSWSAKDKYIGLLTVVKAVGCQDILDIMPDLPGQVLVGLSDLTVAGAGVDLYEACLRSSFPTCGCEEEWMDVWVQPLLSSQDDDSVEMKRLLSVAMQLSEGVVDRALRWQACSSSSPSTTTKKQSRRLALLAVKVRKKKQSDWKEYLENAHFVASLRSYNDTVRLDALDCICTSRSSAESFSKMELEAAYVVIAESLLIEETATRQDFLSLFKKILLRLQESTASRKGKVSTDEKDFTEFLGSLEVFFFSSLLDGANFHRRSMALDCLNLASAIFPQMLRTVAAEENVRSLVTLLEDNFEQVQTNALVLLQRCPAAALGYDSREKAGSLWKRCVDMCSSNSPVDSASASFLIRFVMGTPGFGILAAESGFGGDTVSYGLDCLLESLKSQLGSGAHKPVYGLLLCIRQVMTSASWTSDDRRSRLQSWSAHLLTACQKLRDMTSLILDSDSPEGSTFDEEEEGSSQAVLVAAWRSCKEASLLLGTLVNVSPLTISQLESVVAFFVDVLSNTVHRGAFEQAFVGFTEVCVFLWRSCKDSPEVRRLVETLLEKTLGEVKERNFCPTRRSAGIPFLIQALLVGETVALGGANSHLAETMEALLGSAAAGSAEESLRVQAFNILRTLYRNTRLGEDVGIYAEQGVKVAIIGFKSASWAERNAASLLFSALITRIFGVKRNRNEFSHKNSITTRVFFRRFPSLDTTLKTELTSATENKERREGALASDEAALYPVLIILAKLGPSPQSTSGDEIKIADFLPALFACCGSPILNIRELSAKVLVRLFPAEDLVGYISNFTSCLNDDNVPSTFSPIHCSSANTTHGQLTVVLYLARGGSGFVSQFGTWLIEKGFLELLLLRSRCYAIKSTALEIILELHKNVPECRAVIEDKDLLASKILSCLKAEGKTMAKEESTSHHGRANFIRLASKCCLRFSSNKTQVVRRQLLGQQHSPPSLVKLIRKGALEELIVGITFTAELSGLLAEMLISEEDGQVLELLMEACRNESLISSLADSVRCGMMRKIEHCFNWSSRECWKISALNLFTLLLNVSKDQMQYTTSWSKLMDQEALSSERFGLEALRQCTAQSLLKNKELILASGSQEPTAFILWKLLLSFSVDDLPDIRQIAAKILYSFLSDEDGMSGFVTPSTLCKRLAEVCLKKCETKSAALLVLTMEAFKSPEDDANRDGQTLQSQVFEKSESNNWREDGRTRAELMSVVSSWMMKSEENRKVLKEKIPCSILRHASSNVLRVGKVETVEDFLSGNLLVDERKRYNFVL